MYGLTQHPVLYWHGLARRQSINSGVVKRSAAGAGAPTASSLVAPHEDRNNFPLSFFPVRRCLPPCTRGRECDAKREINKNVVAGHNLLNRVRRSEGGLSSLLPKLGISEVVDILSSAKISTAAHACVLRASHFVLVGSTTPVPGAMITVGWWGPFLPSWKN